jgi:aminoglycoside 6'-N-acetyltransferase I
MKIIDLTSENSQGIQQAAILLMEGFRDSASSDWNTLSGAMVEVEESLHPHRISRAAIDDGGNVVGWISGMAEYNGNVWELHPLVVRAGFRKQGIGRALVIDFEEQVFERGGCTIFLGTDDENNRTSIGGVDLYPNVLSKLQTIKNLSEHPFEFYQKLGFEIVGIIPDANGIGKPDIQMAKRVGKITRQD